MKVTFLGTGTSQGIPVLTCNCDVCLSTDLRDKRLRTSILIQNNKDNIIIDAGPDFRQQMLNHSVKYLDAVLLTHAHHDHVSGLDDVRAFNFSQKISMPIYGTSSCLSDLKLYYDYAFEEEKYPGAPEFNLTEIKSYDLQIKNTKITPIPVMHGKLQILGFRIKNFAYITDASYIPDTSLDLLKKLDVLIINALRHETHHSHFSISETLDIIDRLSPASAYLIHISHIAGKHENLIKEMPKHTQPAYDGLVIEV